MYADCIKCDYKQVSKVCKLLLMSQDEEKSILARVKEYLDSCDMEKNNPEIMGEIWSVMGCDDSYKDIKNTYNQMFLTLYQDIIHYIGDDLHRALEVAISSNLVDFSAKDCVSKEEIIQQLFTPVKLKTDHSQKLFQSLKDADKLLYIGDNCGEIVCDKIFISMLKKHYPQLHVYYAVRGLAIVNDVTKSDAKMVCMDEVAEVIDTGDGSLGTVLSRCSENFQKAFNQADTVICKGQGNYEGLIDCKKEQLYFLFMVKCKLMARLSHVLVGDIVCMKGQNDEI